MAGELNGEGAPFSASNGSSGVLLLHGFTGNPRSMRPLAEAFADAGFAVELPLLPGHGTRVEDLVPMRFPDWSAVAEAGFLALSARCDKTLVAGLSMGGTLACWLAERHRDVAGLVLVNPFVQPPAPPALATFGRALAEGATVMPAIGSDIAKAGADEGSYDQTPIAALLSLFDAAGEVAARLHEIGCPVLLFSSRSDHVVPPESGDLLVNKVAGPIERVYLEHSYHVATLDHDAGEIEERSIAFATKVAS